MKATAGEHVQRSIVESQFSSQTPGRRRRVAIAALGISCLAAPLLASTAAQGAPDTASGTVAAQEQRRQSADDRPRAIITQDGEIDDMDSFVRLLYYSNEIDIEGIVYSSSRFHWRGEDPDAPPDVVLEDGTVVGQCGGGFTGPRSCLEPHRWTGTDWLWEYLDEYEEIYPNLIRHADGYPTPDYLRSIYKIGNVDYSSDMAKDTEGSDWIKMIMLDDDPRTLYVQAWGGLNTVARALKSIEDEYSGTPEWDAIVEKINSKVVIYNILNQDNTLADYIKPNWPGIPILDNQSQFWSFAYQWARRVPEPYRYTLESAFMRENFLTGHGELLAGYHTWGDGQALEGEPVGEDRWSTDKGQFPTSGRQQYDFISEGDTPAYMFLFDFNGLRSREDPTWGGWGGRFAPNASGWIDTSDYNPFTGAADRSFPLTRWVEDIQNDFAARADWGVTESYEDANHNPQATVAQGVDLKKKAGQMVPLTAVASDPDGDKLTYRWWQYVDAGTYPGEVELRGAESRHAKFVVPADAKPGQTIHVILEVSDGGTPTLKHYQRVVLTVR